MIIESFRGDDQQIQSIAAYFVSDYAVLGLLVCAVDNADTQAELPRGRYLIAHQGEQGTHDDGGAASLLPE